MKKVNILYCIIPFVLILLLFICFNWNKIQEKFYANTPFVWRNPVKSVYENPLLHLHDEIYHYYVAGHPAKGPAVLHTGFIPNPYYHRHTKCNCGNNM